MMQTEQGININLEGKTAIVTGGTRGIGKAIVEKLLDAGAHVIATGTNADKIRELNQGSKNDALTYVAVDFANQQSTDEFLQFVDGMNKIDVLINNAGINIIEQNIDTSAETYDSILTINLKAPYLLSRVIGKKMMESQRGRIVNITSIWSEITRPGRSLYATSKNGLAGLTKSLATEFAEHNVLVNAVGPGFTLTELTKKTNTEEELKSLSEKVPLKRMAQPEEIANLVLFLCSDLNTYMTGQNIIIDGGYTNV